MINTMTDLFASIFQHDDVLEWARELGALKRLREIHPADLCLAITHCAMGDETRSIATARRAFFTLTGFMPEESSFYDRFPAFEVVSIHPMIALHVADDRLDSLPSSQPSFDGVTSVGGMWLDMVPDLMGCDICDFIAGLDAQPSDMVIQQCGEDACLDWSTLTCP